METLQNVTDVNATSLSVQLALAVQGTFIIFFVVSPLMGYLLARGIQNRVNFVISWCAGTLVILVGSFGLNLLLRRLIPVEALPDVAVTILSTVAAVAAGILLARYLVWWQADPGKPAWVIAHDKMELDEMMPFEKRRRHEMERRKRNQ